MNMFSVVVLLDIQKTRGNFRHRWGIYFLFYVFQPYCYVYHCLSLNNLSGPLVSTQIICI